MLNSYIYRLRECFLNTIFLACSLRLNFNSLYLDLYCLKHFRYKTEVNILQQLGSYSGLVTVARGPLNLLSSDVQHPYHCLLLLLLSSLILLIFFRCMSWGFILEFDLKLQFYLHILEKCAHNYECYLKFICKEISILIGFRNLTHWLVKVVDRWVVVRNSELRSLEPWCEIPKSFS